MNGKILVFVAALALAGGAALAGDRGGRPTFESLDTDGDELLTEAELDALPSRGNRTGADRLARLDGDGDGYVTRDEMQQARQNMASRKGSMHGGRPNFDAFDTDGDGQLSRDEMSQMKGPRGAPPEDLFDRMDADGDGYVTEEERQTLRKQWQEGGHGHGRGKGPGGGYGGGDSQAGPDD